MNNTKLAFLNFKCPVEKVPFPELGVDVFVRKLSEAEVRQALDNKTDAFAVCKGVCDEHGARVWEDVDLDSIAQQPFEFNHRIAMAVVKFNGLDGSGDDNAKNS